MSSDKLTVDNISKDRIGSASSNANPPGGQDDKLRGKSKVSEVVKPMPHIDFGPPPQIRST